MFHLLTRLHFSSTRRFEFRSYHVLVLAVGVALAAFAVLTTTTHAKVAAPSLTLLAFMTLEFAAGL